MTVIIGGTGTANGITSFSSPATFGGTLATASRGISKASIPSGGIIQVIYGHNNTYATTTSTSYTSLDTSPTIIPTSATSRIFVFLSTMVSRGVASGNVFFAVYRNGSTSLLQSGQTCHFSHWNDSYTSYIQNDVGWGYVDSPATTSSTYYNIFGKVEGGGSPTAYLGGRSGDTSHNCGVMWTLMEIAQ